MTKIYLYKAENGLCCMTEDEIVANDAAIHSGLAVYALDVEMREVTPPKKERWVVEDNDGESIRRGGFFTGRLGDESVSYARESDARDLMDVLTSGGMTGLSIRKIDGE